MILYENSGRFHLQKICPAKNGVIRFRRISAKPMTLVGIKNIIFQNFNFRVLFLLPRFS